MPDPQPPAPGPLLRDVSRKTVGPEGTKRSVSLVPQRRFLLSAFSCKRNAPFRPCNPGFCQLGTRGLGRDEKERFVYITAPLLRFSVLMQARRSFVLAILVSATSAHGGSEGTKRSVLSASQHHFCVSALSCKRNTFFRPCNHGLCHL